MQMKLILPGLMYCWFFMLKNISEISRRKDHGRKAVISRKM